MSTDKKARVVDYSKRLGEVLLQEGAITSEELESAFDLQSKTGQKIGRILTDLGYTTENIIVRCLAASMGIQYVDLQNYDVDQAAVKAVSVKHAEKHLLLPLRINDKRLTVAMSDPLDLKAIGEIEFITGLHVNAVTSTLTDIRKAIQFHYYKTMPKKLGEILVDDGVISHEQLNECLARQRKSKKKLGDLIVELGYSTEAKIARALSKQLNLPYMDLTFTSATIAALEFIPKDFAVKHTLIPLRVTGSTIEIAMANPMDIDAVKELKNLLKKDIFLSISTPTEIKNAIQRHYTESTFNKASGVMEIETAGRLQELFAEARDKDSGGEEGSIAFTFGDTPEPKEEAGIPFPANDLPPANASSIQFPSPSQLEIQSTAQSAIEVKETGEPPKTPKTFISPDAAKNKETTQPTAAAKTPDVARTVSSEALKFVNKLLFSAVKNGATDIHIEPSKEFSQIRMRIDGVMSGVARVQAPLDSGIAVRIKSMAGMASSSAQTTPKDDIVNGGIKIRVENRNIDINVSIIPTQFGEHLFLKIADTSAPLLKLGDIGLDENNFHLLQSVIQKGEGLVLVAGPSGSGKTTTLYAMLDSLANGRTKVFTVENPVKRRIDNVVQMSVNIDDSTFASTLLTVVQQGPDVVMVGQLQDADTAEAIVRAAGRGCFATAPIDAPTSLSAIKRLKALYADSQSVAASINAVVTQRLLRKLCDKCKEHYMPSEDELQRLSIKDLRVDAGKLFYRAKGCSDCGGRGYRGRTGIFEILPIDSQLRKHIEDNDGSALRQACSTSQANTLKQDGIRKILSGITTVEEVLIATSSITPCEFTFCTTCEEPLRGDYKFCPFCGNPLNRPAP